MVRKITVGLTILAILLGIAAALTTYASRTSPQFETVWLLAEKAPYRETLIATGLEPWRVLNTTTQFDAGAQITGNLTLRGERPAQGPYEPRVCILTELAYRQLDHNQPIENQSVECFKEFSYHSSDQTYVINFLATLPTAGRYYLLFLTNRYGPAEVAIYELVTRRSR